MRVVLLRLRSADGVQRASKRDFVLPLRPAFRRARGADTARFRKSDDPGRWIVDPVTPVDVADREDGPGSACRAARNLNVIFCKYHSNSSLRGSWGLRRR